MKRTLLIIGLTLFVLGTLVVGCGGNNNNATKEATGSNASEPVVDNSSEASDADALNDAVLGADISYFDSKFGAAVQKDDESTLGYIDGKLRVLNNNGIAYTIFNDYGTRNEKVSAEDAFSFIKQFLPLDAKLIKEDENTITKEHIYTYTSEALKTQAQLSGQLIINIRKNQEDSTSVLQAQISIDITGDM